MNRDKNLQYLKEFKNEWDLVIIGGGATGLGIAVDASSRGYKTLLLEQSDLTKGTSSRSTKLVHGGVRYLEQGNIKLVFEALRERGILLKNAPHLVSNLEFIIPVYSWWKAFYYGIGMILYDFLSRSLSLGKSGIIGKKKTLRYLPGIRKKRLKAGILYHDGQFDDSRLGISLARTADSLGGCIINYMKVTGFEKNENGKIISVLAQDTENETKYKIPTNLVINATGIFSDRIFLMDNSEHKPLITLSRGTHIVLDRSFLPGNHALLIPKTSDKRVLFALPWHDKLLVGTTDVPANKELLEPTPDQNEIQFILNNFSKYTDSAPGQGDIKAIFAGLRPLVKSRTSDTGTREISRSHKIHASPGGLISIMGGKWTTYRKMAEDTLYRAISMGLLANIACKTNTLKIHGYSNSTDVENHFRHYGTDLQQIQAIAAEQPALNTKIHQNYPFILAEIVWAARYEMARTIEDFLARRIRLLFLDALAAIDSAPIVGKYMAVELKKDETWVKDQIEKFENVASAYLPKN